MKKVRAIVGWFGVLSSTLAETIFVGGPFPLLCNHMGPKKSPTQNVADKSQAL